MVWIQNVASGCEVLTDTLRIHVELPAHDGIQPILPYPSECALHTYNERQ